MMVNSFTVEGITSLVRNSPKLITLYLQVSVMDVGVEYFNATIEKLIWNSKLFTAGRYELVVSWDISLIDVIWEQGTDLYSLWP